MRVELVSGEQWRMCRSSWDAPHLMNERRAVLEEVLDVIYLTPHQAMAVRPSKDLS
jgi:hypothetical protein